MESISAQHGTFPKWLAEQARVRGTRPALREKHRGIWQTLTWGEYANEVHLIANALHLRGLGRGQHAAMIGDNRPHLYVGICAAQCLGAIAVPLYQDAAAEELIPALQRAAISVVFAEDQEQVDKILEILPQCPSIQYVVYDDDRGMRHYQQPQLVSYQALLNEGRNADTKTNSSVKAAIAQGSGADVAFMFFTSGTTGTAKGVVLTHAALIDRARAAAEMEQLNETDVALAYLPPAWIGQSIFSYAQPLVAGYCVGCPESGETMLADMREIGPTYFFAPPRVLEALLTRVSIRMESAGSFKRWLYQWATGVAKKVGGKILAGAEVPAGDRLSYWLADLLILAPLRDVLGMGRVRVAYTAGEAIGPDLLNFYRSIGINLKQLYGSTETSVFVCLQPNTEVKPDTVGPVVRGVELKFTDTREILVRSPGLFREYFAEPAATREAIDSEGWFHTGDAGYLGDDGHLRVIDRVKDVGQLADATMFAPKYIENKLKFFPYIKEVVAFGEGRDRVCIFVNIDLDAVGSWADNANISYTGYTDLASRDEVYALVADCVEKVNTDLAADPKLSGSQIHRFLILHKELDADDGELTRTRKVRRGFIAERYQSLVAALYSNSERVRVDAEVKYEDGRVDTVSADVQLRNAKTFPATSARLAA